MDPKSLPPDLMNTPISGNVIGTTFDFESKVVGRIPPQGYEVIAQSAKLAVCLQTLQDSVVKGDAQNTPLGKGIWNLVEEFKEYLILVARDIDVREQQFQRLQRNVAETLLKIDPSVMEERIYHKVMTTRVEDYAEQAGLEIVPTDKDLGLSDEGNNQKLSIDIGSNAPDTGFYSVDWKVEPG